MKFTEYLGFHYSFYRTLILQLGLDCTLRCRHCSVFAAPGRRERMAPELVQKAIRDFAKAGEERLVVLTGGEPFAMPEFRVALDEAASCGLATYAITSAYWAESMSRAKEALLSLPPLSLMMVSADVYHEEFVPLDRVGHAVRASHELGRDVCVTVAIDRGDEAYVDRVAETVGRKVWDAIEHDVVPVMPTGRASSQGLGWFDTVPQPAPEGACDLLGTPVVVHDGTVSCCCQIDATNEITRRPDSVYRIGNVHVDSYDDLRERVEGNPLFQALRVWGPSTLLQMLRDDGFEPKVAAGYSGICFLCRDLLCNPEAVRRLRRLLGDAQLQNEIRLSRMIQYGELRPCPAGLRDGAP